MPNPPTPAAAPALTPRLYDGDAESILRSDLFPDRVTLLPGAPAGEGRLRILWGQDMLRDVLDGRYRSVVCGVNDEDNSHGIVAHLVELVRTSQWRAPALTSYARMFQASVADHAAHDREPYILKYDLDSVLILAILRPRGRAHFTLEDLSRGFATVAKMLQGRRDRLPAASVSFLGARSNRLVGPGGEEPSFEAVLRTMFDAGFHGDVYPAPGLWRYGHVGVFPSYPFPESVDAMRGGGH